ncbi:MAG: outer membrane beta-barrel protein [Nitrospirae bacterium]|nr:outer membrane beta-barrel protein [Nitrospirota bacterium]
MYSYRFSVRSCSAVFIGVVLCFIPVFGSVPSAVAVGNLRLGPVEIHPYLQLSESLDDNVCRTERKECPDPSGKAAMEDAADLFTVFSPGLQLALPLQGHRFQAEYRGDFGRYQEFKTENYSDNTVKGDLFFDFPVGLSIRLKDDWKTGHDPRGFSQNVGLDFYHRNTAGADFGFRAGPMLRVAVNYTNMVLNYSRDAGNGLQQGNGFRDRTDNTLGGTLYYRFLPKTSVLLEYSQTEVSFDDDDPFLGSVDSQVQRGYLGLTWEITARSQGTLKGGTIRKKFDEADAEFSGGIVSLAVDHEMSARTTLHLDAERDVRESNLVSQPFYVSTGGRLELDHLIHSRVSTNLKGAYTRDQYPETMTVGAQTEKRLDDTWTAGAGLEYRPQTWLSLGLRYDHSQRRSNLDGLGYSDNLYAFRLGLVL